MPLSFGSPRSTIATSSAYSRPQYKPSSPSAAASTLKPACCSCSTMESRRGFSSSTISTRMGSVHRSRFGVHSHGPHLAFGAQQADLVHPPPAILDGFRLDGLGAETALCHLDGLIQRHAARLDPRVVPLTPIDQLLALAGQRRTRRKQRKEGQYQMPASAHERSVRAAKR